jgi:septal ring factor EnvC (AmiA/AmiB activator)
VTSLFAGLCVLLALFLLEEISAGKRIARLHDEKKAQLKTAWTTIDDTRDTLASVRAQLRATEEKVTELQRTVDMLNEFRAQESARANAAERKLIAVTNSLGGSVSRN